MTFAIKHTSLSFFFFAMLSVTAALAQSKDSAPSIEVFGSGEVKVVPDEIAIQLGVNTIDPSLEKAKEENDERVKKILAIAQEASIDAKDVQTDYLRISPRYESGVFTSTFKGYEVSVSIAIILHDISKYETVMSKALKAGANYVQGATFRTTELRRHRDEARRLALIAAREKATAMAAVLGQSIGRPLSIVESGTGGRWFAQSQSNAIVDDGEQTSGEESSTLALGRINVSASVTVRFELLDRKPGQP